MSYNFNRGLEEAGLVVVKDSLPLLQKGSEIRFTFYTMSNVQLIRQVDKPIPVSAQAFSAYLNSAPKRIE